MRYLVLLVLTVNSLYAQHDSTVVKEYVLPEVSVSHERVKDFATGLRLNSYDSLSLANKTAYTLAEQLSFSSTNFIRVYGQNGLATLSLQGSTDVHSALIWNGFNLQSIMNGTVDLSQLPVFFTDEVVVQSGSSSHIWGSGSAGGSVLLNNKPEYASGLRIKLNTEAGNYGLWRQQLKLGYGRSNWYTNVRVFYSKAENDYPLQNETRGVLKLTHAFTEQRGVLAESYLKVKRHHFAVRSWVQNNYRQNPLTEFNGTLFHDFLRTNGEYKNEGKLLSKHVRFAWLREDILYLDPVRSENTRSIADGLTGESEWSLKWRNKHFFNAGLNSSLQRASVVTENYSVIGNIINSAPEKYSGGSPVRYMAALFGQYKICWLSEKFYTQVSLRQELIKNYRVPFVPSAGIDYLPFKWLIIKANISRLFRVPTFNELFWVPGGNKDLIPENGWNVETSGKITTGKNQWSVFYEAVIFRRKIFNWIRWVPDGSHWSAKNVAEVTTRGFENKAGLRYTKRRSTLKISLSSTYVYSAAQKSLLKNDKSLGLQVIFIPMYLVNGNITYSIKGFHVEYNHNYSGYVYTASDHSQWLSPFHAGNIIVSQTMKKGKFAISVTGKIQNVWNAYYRTVTAYPMPPRNFSAGILFQFN